MSTETNSPADAALMQAARERYESALQRYALHQLGGEAGAVQEILAGVWQEFRSLPATEMGEQAGEWLFLNCRRRLQTGQGKGQAKHLEAGSAEGEGGADTGRAAVDENEEPYLTMRRLIDRLTPKQQEAVRLRFQNDFSVPAVATITELTSYNVGALLHNAVARLGRDYRRQHPAESGGENKGIGDDARLTLYALGEMEDAESRAFEDSLIDKKSAAMRVEEVRAISADRPDARRRGRCPGPAHGAQKKAQRSRVVVEFSARAAAGGRRGGRGGADIFLAEQTCGGDCERTTREGGFPFETGGMERRRSVAG